MINDKWKMRYGGNYLDPIPIEAHSTELLALLTCSRTRYPLSRISRESRPTHRHNQFQFAGLLRSDHAKLLNNPQSTPGLLKGQSYQAGDRYLARCKAYLVH